MQEYVLFVCHDAAICYRLVCRRCQGHHMREFHGACDAWGGIFWMQDEHPPARSMSVFEEGDPVTRAGDCLVSTVASHFLISYHLPLPSVGATHTPRRKRRRGDVHIEQRNEVRPCEQFLEPESHWEVVDHSSRFRRGRPVEVPWLSANRATAAVTVCKPRHALQRRRDRVRKGNAHVDADMNLRA